MSDKYKNKYYDQNMILIDQVPLICLNHPKRNEPWTNYVWTKMNGKYVLLGEDFSKDYWEKEIKLAIMKLICEEVYGVLPRNMFWDLFVCEDDECGGVHEECSCRDQFWSKEDTFDNMTSYGFFEKALELKREMQENIIIFKNSS